MLVLGGGGYTIKNVARCWVYETAVILDTELSNELPYNDYLEHYGPEYTLHITPSNMENQNSREYLEKVKNSVLQRLRQLPPAPSVAQHDIPPDSMNFSDNEDEEDPDEFSVREEDTHIQQDNELYVSDDEEERNIDIGSGTTEEGEQFRHTNKKYSIYHNHNNKTDSENSNNSDNNNNNNNNHHHNNHNNHNNNLNNHNNNLNNHNNNHNTKDSNNYSNNNNNNNSSTNMDVDKA